MVNSGCIHRIGCLGLALSVAGTCAAAAQDGSASDRRLAGPVSAIVLKVRDGDTVEVEALIWPSQVVRTAVRLRGIDAPELKAACPAEREAAAAARDRLAGLVAGGPVALTGIAGDKYFGRVLADLSAEGVPDVSRTLLDEGFVAAYRGGARRDWCAGAAALRPDRSRTPG